MIRPKISFVTILMIILITGNGYSQERPIRLGLKVAPNIAWMNPGEKNYHYEGVNAGVALGFVAEFTFAEHYAVCTGFNFSFLNGRLSFPYAEPPDTGTLNRKYNFRYLEVPLSIKMKTKEYGNFCFFGQIGFGTGFNLRTRVNDDFKTTKSETITDKKNLSTSETAFIREAILVGLGTEYKIDESVTLVLGLAYSNSLNNVLQGKNPSDPNLTNKSSLNYVELNLGVLF
jgi:hypothetical protein